MSDAPANTPQPASTTLRDSAQAQLLAIEETLRKIGKRPASLGMWVPLEGVEVRLTINTEITVQLLKQRAEELRNEIGARMGSDSFKAFVKRALGK